MSELLKEHEQKKKNQVSLLDRISMGLGAMGGCLIIACILQPGSNANSARLVAGFSFFAASVGAERVREEDVESLERAIGLQKEIKSERIRLDVALNEKLHRIDYAEAVFAVAPIDRHVEIAQELGVAPPNYEARQPKQSQPAAAAPASPTATMPDPTGDFDPEPPEPGSIGQEWGFISAEFVEDWFKKMGSQLPQGLINEWRDRPGEAIEVDGVNVKIIRGKV
jgi:hypothetical protein